ncbi:MAG: hypothetical protein JWM74_2337 [Myxococcaceae bacterium]|nr:hypothetical protein [Myxococcaceae bacterium]
MRRTVFALSILLAAAATACSSSDKPGVHGPTGPGTVVPEEKLSADATWGEGKTLAGSIIVETGVTVTVAAGAHIKVADGATITVKGTLKSPGGAPAFINAESDTANWGGIIVAPGGTLALKSVHLENAEVALLVQAGAKSATYDAGIISDAHVPFQVDAKGKLSMTDAKVLRPTGTSQVEGSYVASHLDYDSNANDGIRTMSDDATLSIDDSTMHGQRGTGDMIASYDGAATIHVAYTNFTMVHCAFHLLRVTNLDISNVTSDGNIYGLMLHGSLEGGTKTVKNMNIIGSIEWGVHELDDAQNAAISFTGTYFNGNRNGDLYLKTGTAIAVTNNATTKNQTDPR